MEGTIAHTYLSDILHAVSQALLVPDIILLLAFIGYSLFCIGSIVVELFTERRHFKATMPKFLSALMSADEDAIPAVIEESGLLKRQKEALLTVYEYHTLPGDAFVALIRRLVSEEEGRYDRITGRNNTAARVSPMLGLMGTLIPLGPGIQALGRADTSALSSSLLIAFDTTVAGLVVAAICLVVGKIRSAWYANYMSALDSAMATMHQKVEEMRGGGEITVEEPLSYSFLYEQTPGRVSSAINAEAPESQKDSAEEQPAPQTPAEVPQSTETQAVEVPQSTQAKPIEVVQPTEARPIGLQHPTQPQPVESLQPVQIQPSEELQRQLGSSHPVESARPADPIEKAPALSVPQGVVPQAGASTKPRQVPQFYTGPTLTMSQIVAMAAGE